MKPLTKHSWIVLPLLVLLSLCGWWLFGALTQKGITDDLLSWLSALPITTCYALASLVAALFAMQVTGMNLANDYRWQLVQRSADGDRHALYVLIFEAACWFGMFHYAALYFVPKR